MKSAVVQKQSAVVQKHPWGCGVACVAYVLQIPYNQALTLFDKYEDSIPGYYCPDIEDALVRGGLMYEWYQFQPEVSGEGPSFSVSIENLPYDSIVFTRPGKKYVGGHWLVKTPNGWMNPWSNFPSTIEDAQSGFTELPDLITWVVIPEKEDKS